MLPLAELNPMLLHLDPCDFMPFCFSFPSTYLFSFSQARKLLLSIGCCSSPVKCIFLMLLCLHKLKPSGCRSHNPLRVHCNGTAAFHWNSLTHWLHHLNIGYSLPVHLKQVGKGLEGDWAGVHFSSLSTAVIYHRHESNCRDYIFCVLIDNNRAINVIYCIICNYFLSF